jgi:putative protein kinase ArgK-like GTPase of G3E family
MGALATRTQAELEATLQREHPDGGWQVPVLATSVPQVVGIEALTDMLEQHRAHMESSNTLHRRRRGYRAHWILKRLEEEFGAFGITQLGGPNALLKQLQQADVNGLQQYDTLRRALYNARTDT